MAGISTVSDDWQSITYNDVITGLKYNTDFVSGGFEPVYFIGDKSIKSSYANDTIQNCTQILANLLRSNDNLTIKTFEATGENKYPVGKCSNIQYVARYIDSKIESITSTSVCDIPLDVSEKIGKYDTRFTSNGLGGQLVCRITSNDIEYLRAFTISGQEITLLDTVTGSVSAIASLAVDDRFELINAYDILEEGLEETTGYPVQGFVKKHVKPNEDTSYIEFSKYDTPAKLSCEKVVIAYNALDDYNQTFIYDGSIDQYGIFTKKEDLNFALTQSQLTFIETTLKKFIEPNIVIELETFRPSKPLKGWNVNVNIPEFDLVGIFKITRVSEVFISETGQLIDKPFRLWKVTLSNYENNLASVLAGLKRRADLGKSKLATNQVLRTAIDINLQTKFIDDPSEYGLDTPVALDADPINNDDFTALWEAVPNANNYILVASLSPTFDSVINGFGGIYTGNVLSYVVDGQEITDNDTFYFKVKAVNTDLNLESDFSNTITVNKITIPNFTNDYAWDLLYNSDSMTGSGLSITDSINSIVANFYRNTSHNGTSDYPSWVTDGTFGNGILFNKPASALRIADDSVIDITTKSTWLFILKFKQISINQILLNKVSSSNNNWNAYQFSMISNNESGSGLFDTTLGTPLATSAYLSDTDSAFLVSGDIDVVIGVAFSFDLATHTMSYIKNQTSYTSSRNMSYAPFSNINTINNSPLDLFIGSFLWDNGSSYISGYEMKAEIYRMAMIKDKLTDAQIKAEFAQMGLT